MCTRNKWVGFLILWMSVAQADEQPPVCGVIQHQVGHIQVLDRTRTQMLSVHPHSILPCGSWVSVTYGWVQIQHTNGPIFHLSRDTSIQLLDFKGDSQFKGDHLTLFHGQLYVKAENGEAELRILTSIGRARITHGRAIVMVSKKDDQTQLIGLANSASLENRFEPSRKVKVQAGESTELNFKLLRVVPTFPAAVSVASLRPRLEELQVSEREQKQAVQGVVKRQERVFAARLDANKTDENKTSEKKKSDRAPASLGSAKSYLRHDASPVDEALRWHGVQKLVGGEQVGEKILYPDRFYGKSQRVQVEVHVPETRTHETPSNSEEVEKKYLIEELTRIRAE